jgi:hypothetical protein
MEVTSKTHFCPKKIDCKNLGRKIMQDINGNTIPNECRDIDFLAD